MDQPLITGQQGQRLVLQISWLSAFATAEVNTIIEHDTFAVCRTGTMNVPLQLGTPLRSEMLYKLAKHSTLVP